MAKVPRKVIIVYCVLCDAICTPCVPDALMSSASFSIHSQGKGKATDFRVKSGAKSKAQDQIKGKAQDKVKVKSKVQDKVKGKAEIDIELKSGDSKLRGASKRDKTPDSRRLTIEEKAFEQEVAMEEEDEMEREMEEEEMVCAACYRIFNPRAST